MAVNELPGEVHSYGISFLPSINNRELSKGCQSCKKGSWLCVRVGIICNLACSYCPRKRSGLIEDDDEDFLISQNKKVSADSLKELLLAPHGIDGISYTGGEPFLYVDKIIDMAAFVSKNLPSIYQWVYTNGLLPTADSMKKLKDAGVQEIRFHIGASNFDETALKNASIAVGIFPRVTVETPSTPALYEYLIKNKQIHSLVDIGIRQLNLPELYFLEGKAKNGNIPADYYKFSGSSLRLISPKESHNITRAIISYSYEHKIDILINDCSNEAKDLQVRQRFFSGKIPDAFFNFEHAKLGKD